MKQSLTAVAFFAFALTVSAETFLGVTSATNRLVVATNEVLLIQKLYVQAGATIQLVKDGNIYNLNNVQVEALNPAAVAGPCELVLTNQTLVHFKRIISSGIQTLVLRPATTNIITVPVGVDIRFFRPLGLNNVGAIIRRGQSELAFVDLSSQANDELSGPIEISMRNPYSPPITSDMSISYVLLQPAQSLQQQGVIQGPTGRFQVIMETSLNLTNWTTSTFQDLVDDQKAYYRLRIIK